MKYHCRMGLVLFLQGRRPATFGMKDVVLSEFSICFLRLTLWDSGTCSEKLTHAGSRGRSAKIPYIDVASFLGALGAIQDPSRT